MRMAFIFFKDTTGTKQIFIHKEMFRARIQDSRVDKQRPCVFPGPH